MPDTVVGNAEEPRKDRAALRVEALPVLEGPLEHIASNVLALYCPDAAGAEASDPVEVPVEEHPEHLGVLHRLVDHFLVSHHHHLYWPAASRSVRAGTTSRSVTRTQKHTSVQLQAEG